MLMLPKYRVECNPEALELTVYADDSVKVCSECGEAGMKYRDTTPRHMKLPNLITVLVHIPRFRCPKCQRLHSGIPGFLLPYKQYAAEVIQVTL